MKLNTKNTHYSTQSISIELPFSQKPDNLSTKINVQNFDDFVRLKLTLIFSILDKENFSKVCDKEPSEFVSEQNLELPQENLNYAPLIPISSGLKHRSVTPSSSEAGLFSVVDETTLELSSIMVEDFFKSYEQKKSVYPLLPSTPSKMLKMMKSTNFFSERGTFARKIL
jgi:hypothetical protein